MTSKRFLIPILLLLFASGRLFALGEPQVIQFRPGDGALALVAQGKALPLWLDADDDPGVLRAAGDLQADFERVTQIRPELSTAQRSPGRKVILAGTLGTPLIDRLVEAGKLDTTQLEGRWEAFWIGQVEQPAKGVDRALVVVGSDRRGTIYGLYTLSEQMGVSPWYWWADVPVDTHEALYARAEPLYDDGPTVQYRGIFLNDEAPALTGWVNEKFGGYNHAFYGHLFELILRMKGNFLWPAMWGSAFFDDDAQNGPLADEYGIVMSTSHHEPMNRAHAEWGRYGEGPWEYRENAEKLQQFWTEGIRRSKDWETYITLGMRGDGDEPMSEDANVDLLERIVHDQREILQREMDRPLEDIPQVWALYKEVQEYYERGMRVPDDVTLLWTDDNWGNIRRLPAPDEMDRSGGAGVYYHFDYVGGPRSYKWMNIMPITKIWQQMNLAWQYEANRIWVVNVGDLKPMEFPTEFFLTYAWDPAAWPYERLTAYHRQWAAREFGPEHADAIAHLIATYTKYNSRRKPEQMTPDTFSLIHYDEAERVVADWQALVAEAKKVQAQLPESMQSAYFQLVQYPIEASATVVELYVSAGENQLFGFQGREATNAAADRTVALFERDDALARQYHQINDGKWNHFMAQANLGYQTWQQPDRDTMPSVTRVHEREAAQMAVSLPGSPFSWPSNHPGKGEARTPVLSAVAQDATHLTVFNRGTEAFTFSAQAEPGWLHVTPAEGTVTAGQRLTVSADWSEVPAGEHEGKVTLKGADGWPVTVTVPVVKRSVPADFQGFVETHGYISIEAPHFQRQTGSDVQWRVLEDFGRTLGAVTTFPVRAESEAHPGGESPHLAYDFYVHSAAEEASVNLQFAPAFAFQPGRGLRCAVSIDDEAPEIIEIQATKTHPMWQQAVSNAMHEVAVKRQLEPGAHTLKVWYVDPGVVLQKVVIDLGGLEPSYLGPPESPLMQ
ncbi:MAG: hypothetical protein E1N59_2368 [Puniceicoccaceae bacterium 5H]|nr:MAG: hypothetical protein E1N59_2368 [Puniceicoccaceae bacterium 5H]